METDSPSRSVLPSQLRHVEIEILDCLLSPPVLLSCEAQVGHAVVVDVDLKSGLHGALQQVLRICHEYDVLPVHEPILGVPIQDALVPVLEVDGVAGARPVLFPQELAHFLSAEGFDGGELRREVLFVPR